MQRPSLAARRFYRAFYRWNQLDAATHTHHSSKCRHSDSRGLHVTARQREETGKRQHTVERDEDGGFKIKYSGRRQNIGEPREIRYMKSKVEVPEYFKTQPVESANDVPFHQIPPNKNAIRYRSDTGIMLEMSFFEDDFKVFQRRWGDELEKLSQFANARIELQGTATFAPPPGDGTGVKTLISVLAAGTFEDVAKVTYNLHSFRLGFNKEEKEKHLEKVKMAQHHSSQQQAREAVPVRPLPKWQERKDIGRVDVPNHFRTDPVRSAAEFPFHKFQVGEKAIRHRSEHGLMLEMAVLDKALEELTTRLGKGLRPLSERSGARIDVQDLTAPAIGDDLNPGHTVVSVLLAGTFKEVAYALGVFKTEVGRERKKITITADEMADANAAPLRLTTGHADQEHQQQVISALARPSSSLTPLEHVLRPTSKDSDKTLLELSVQEAEFMKFVIKHDLASAGQKYNVRIEITEPQQRPLDSSSEETGLARSFMVSGSNVNVHEAVRWLKSLFSGAPDQQAPRVGHSSAAVEPHRSKGPPVMDASLTKVGNNQGVVDVPPRLEQAPSIRKANVRPGSAEKLDSPLERYRRTKNRQNAESEAAAILLPEQELLARYPVQTYPEEAAKTSEEIRPILRSLTYPVVLIHTVDKRVRHDLKSRGIWDSFEHYRAVTVSSFNTVALGSRTIISFNLKVPSRTWDVIRAFRTFRISLLKATPRGAAIAHTFTQPYESPYAGFDRLKDLGVIARTTVLKPHRQYIRDKYGGAILVEMVANLLADKVVEIDDHVVVFAEVVRMKSHDYSIDAAANEPALSYSRQSYQGPSGPIKPDYTPVTAEEEPDPLALGEANVAPRASHKSSDAQTAIKDADIPTAKDTVRTTQAPKEQDKLYSALSEAAGLPPPRKQGEEEEDMFAKFSEADGAPAADNGSHSTDAAEVESTHSASDQSTSNDIIESDDSPAPESSQSVPTASQEASATDVGDASADASHDSASDATLKASGTVHPWGLSAPSSYRAFSTLARPSHRKPWTAPPSQRSISSSSVTPTPDPTTILDPTIRSTTVADYFSFPDRPEDKTRKYIPYVKQRSVKGAIRLQREASEARLRLADPEERASLTEEEIATLERQTDLKERTVAKKLAWNATAHLRLMLDKGRYDAVFWQRIPYLEGCIEKGQAVLLEEAKDLKRFIRDGKVSKEKFEEVRSGIEKQNEFMTTETMRLRQVVEEEGLDGNGGAWEKWTEDDD